MKTISKILGIITIGIFVTSCSSVKVADSWKDVKTAEIKDKKILVLSKTNNQVNRVQFEKDLTQSLQKKGYNASESFTIFPEIKTNEKVVDSEEVEKAVKKLKENGIEVVIMTVLREVKHYSTVTTSGPAYYVTPYPMYYRRGFYRYYRTVYIAPYSYPTTETISKGQKYILETLTYDLTQPESNQLVSVITTEVDNPETLSVISEDFAKKVVKVLSK